MDSPAKLTLEPIGYIHTPFTSKADAPHQPDTKAGVEATITLLEGHNFEQALEDLQGIEKIWLIYWFDRNPNWKPKVLVPRGERKKRGVFATRSPHRPNPIGLTLVDLCDVSGLTLRVRNVDLLDGTPILDIKPYLPSIESYPDSATGWIEEMEQGLQAPAYTVSYSTRAEEQLRFLELHGVPLRFRIERVLTRDPFPHPYRRVEHDGERYVQSIRAWRVYFGIEAGDVTVLEIGSGYRKEAFNTGELLSDDEAQREFALAFAHV